MSHLFENCVDQDVADRNVFISAMTFLFTEITILTLIAVCTVFAITTLLSDSRHIAMLLANIASTLGMLGTFVGIYKGLMGFDSADLVTSVPVLLDGMKTAFATSIVGMGANISIRSIDSILNKLKSVNNKAERDTLIEKFNAIEQAITMQAKIMVDTTQAQAQSLEQMALMTDNIISLNSTLRVNQDEMNRIIEETGDKIAQAMADKITNKLARSLSESVNIALRPHHEQLITQMTSLNAITSKLNSNLDYQLTDLNATFNSQIKTLDHNFKTRFDMLNEEFRRHVTNIAQTNSQATSMAKSLAEVESAMWVTASTP